MSAPAGRFLVDNVSEDLKEETRLVQSMSESVEVAVALCPMYMTLMKRRKGVFEAANDLLRDSQVKIDSMHKKLKFWYTVGAKKFEALEGEINKTRVNRILRRFNDGKSIDEIVRETGMPARRVIYVLCNILILETRAPVHNRRTIDMLAIATHPRVSLTKETYNGLELFLLHEKLMPLYWVMQISGTQDLLYIMVVCLTYIKVLSGPVNHYNLCTHLDSTQLTAAAFEEMVKQEEAKLILPGPELDEAVNAKSSQQIQELKKQSGHEIAEFTAQFEALDQMIQEDLSSSSTTSNQRSRQGRIQHSYDQQKSKMEQNMDILSETMFDVDEIPLPESPAQVFDNDPEVDIIHASTSNHQAMTAITEQEIKQLTNPSVSSMVMVREKADPHAAFQQGGRLILKTGNQFTVRLKNGNGKTIRVPRSCIVMEKSPEGYLKFGCRVVARYNAKDIYKPKPKPGWYAGTIVASVPFRATYQYTIMFDGDFAETVHHSQTRLLLQQDVQILNHSEVRFVEPQRFIVTSNPVHYIIKAFMDVAPAFELVRIKRGDADVGGIKRINVKNKEGRDASAWVLQQNGNVVLLRFPKNSADKCTVLRCNQHDHQDEWIYRGHPRFSALVENRTAVNKLMAESGTVAPLVEKVPVPGPSVPSTSSRRHRSIGTAPMVSSTSTSGDGAEQPRGIRLQTARKSGYSKSLVDKSSRPSAREIKAINAARENCNRSDMVFELRSAPDYEKRYSRFSKHKTCSASCLEGIREHNSSYKEYHNCSPYLIPMMNGWSRERLCFTPDRPKKVYHRHAIVAYRSPCGMYMKSFELISKFLRLSGSVLTIDLFTFDPLLETRRFAKPNPDHVVSQDFCGNHEVIPIPVVNSTAPEDPIPKLIYKRTCAPGSRNRQEGGLQKFVTQSKEFCSGCSCEDDCSDPERCECQILTRTQLERLSETLQPSIKGYQNRSLTERCFSGIYECNDNCRCHRSAEKKMKCYNSVVQQDIKFPFMLFRTPECGWGVRTLVDIPPGAFVSNYAGEIYTDAEADAFDRDDYFADLDLVTSVENEKESQGIDNIDNEDMTPARRRKGDGKAEVQFSFNNYFTNADEEKLFIVDALDKGNIGKYYNHCCTPNMRVQNVLVDTHDLRLPWVSFFATRLIRAGEELTWNYGYVAGTVHNRILYCKCGSTKCEGRLL